MLTAIELPPLCMESTMTENTPPASLIRCGMSVGAACCPSEAHPEFEALLDEERRSSTAPA